MAAPGMVSKGMKWMFNAKSPFYIKPRFDLDLIRWGLKFIKSCTNDHVQSSMKSILDINLLSKKLYLEMLKSESFDFHLETKGLLMAYKTSHAEKEESEISKRAKDLGIKVEQFSKEQVLKIQPDIAMDIAGAFWYKSDAHSTPELFVNNLKDYLIKKGVGFKLETTVQYFQKNNKQIQKVVTDKGIFEADEFVLSTGAWSQQILNDLGIKLLIQPGKGYRINVYKSTGITLPAILLESKVAVTPMDGFTRFGGTMEISGINDRTNIKRVHAIADSVTKYYPTLEIPKTCINEVQSGLRPLSPDGLPFIGRHSKIKNMVLATGHSMMGWSLGPATGRLVTEVISGRKTSMDLKPFLPERI